MSKKTYRYIRTQTSKNPSFLAIPLRANVNCILGVCRRDGVRLVLEVVVCVVVCVVVVLKEEREGRESGSRQ